MYVSPRCGLSDAVSYVNDEWRLRLSSLLQIMSDKSDRQEVVSSGLGGYITTGMCIYISRTLC